MTSAKENLYMAVIVLSFGLIIYLLIPFQVSMESIPGSMGFSQVGPATLPRLSAWGIILTGLIWSGRSLWKYISERRSAFSEPDSMQKAAGHDQPVKWTWSIMTWLGMIMYVALIPVWGYMESSAIFGLIVGLAMARPGRDGLKAYATIGIRLFFGVVIIPLSLNYVFYKFFFVPLPTGLFSGLLFGW